MYLNYYQNANKLITETPKMRPNASMGVKGLISKLMQYNAHKTGRVLVGPNVVCLCLHMKKGKDQFDTLNAHFIFVV